MEVGRARSTTSTAMGKRGSPKGKAEGEDGPVVAFYGHHTSKRYCEFSNFWWHNDAYSFTLPEWLQKMRPDFPVEVPCHFSEKAIMVCKAALMGDRETFDQIVASDSPADTKALGRQVHPWDDSKWKAHVQDIADEIVFQKFQSSSRLKELLLSTGDKLIVEATRNDKNWGVGLNVGEPEVQKLRLETRHTWPGTNWLGLALMNARDRFRAEVRAGSEPAASAEADLKASGTEVSAGPADAALAPSKRRWKTTG